MIDLEIELGGVAMRLCPERCAFRADRRELLAADVHLGKASTFRRAGRPLPHGTTRAELDRLDRVIRRTGAERVTFLGDLFHDDVPADGPTIERFAAWLESHQDIEITLVRGNHDRHAAKRIAELALDAVDEGEVVEGIEYRHHPHDHPSPMPHVAGHLHPGARIDDGTDRMRLPAFRIRGNAVLLPAFGAFTGLVVVPHQRGDRIAVVTPTGVVEVPHRILRDR